jgi:hypothetical protein
MRRVVQQFSERKSSAEIRQGEWRPGAALKTGLDHRRMSNPVFILRAEGQQRVSRYGASHWAFTELSFALARDPRRFGSHTSRVEEPRRPRSRLAGSVVMVLRSPRGLHHHRFLERAIVRVEIITLLQIGYTVKKCRPLDRPDLTNATKARNIFAAPSAPASAGGRAMRGRGPGGRTYLIALGAVPLRYLWLPESIRERR